MSHGFTVEKRLEVGAGLGRAGTIATPHGQILTPAFIPVGTKATVKSVLPEAMAGLGAQALLANAYHLYLQPGPQIVDQAGGLGAFMNWPGPTYTDSGGFQVLSLGAGYKKVLSEEFAGKGGAPAADGAGAFGGSGAGVSAGSGAGAHGAQGGPSGQEARAGQGENVSGASAEEGEKITNRSGAKRRAREELEEAEPQNLAPGAPGLARVDNDGVNFRSHLDGSRHRFTPEVSMQIQHQLGADIIFAFDELTSLLHPYDYQVTSLERTRRWAERCLREHARLTRERSHRTYQQLFGVIQGAQWEDLRRKAARDLGSMEIDGQSFDGFGVGGALEKENLGTIVGWVCSELPENKARHLLGISEPDDFFVGVEAGADTFDCVSPSRVARTGAAYLPTGRTNMGRAEFRADFSPLQEDCGCYTCAHYTRAYLHHLLKAKEMLSATLLTIHNEFFIVNLMAGIRSAIIAGASEYQAFKEQTLGRYYGS